MERMTARFSTPCFLKSQRFTGGRVRSHQGHQPIPQRRSQGQPNLLGRMGPGFPLPRPGASGASHPDFKHHTTWGRPRVPPGQTLQVTEHYRIRTTGTDMGGRDEHRTTTQGGQARAFSAGRGDRLELASSSMGHSGRSSGAGVTALLQKPSQDIGSAFVAPSENS